MGEQIKTKWISVDDKLPNEETNTLLVATYNGESIITDTDGFENGRFTFWKDNVTHWMYLPSPPSILLDFNVAWDEAHGGAA